MSCALDCHCQSRPRSRSDETHTRPRSKSDDEWLVESPGLIVAYELLEAGKISTAELQQIVAQDRLWHTGERDATDMATETLNPYCAALDGDNGELLFHDIEAQVTDEDFFPTFLGKVEFVQW